MIPYLCLVNSCFKFSSVRLCRATEGADGALTARDLYTDESGLAVAKMKKLSQAKKSVQNRIDNKKMFFFN